MNGLRAKMMRQKDVYINKCYVLATVQFAIWVTRQKGSGLM